MAHCIRCGKPIADGELFCEECSMTPLRAEPVRRTPSEQERMRPPRTARTQTQAPPAASKKSAGKMPRGVLAAMIVLSVLAAAAFTLVIVQALGAHSQRVQLRVREEALDAREAEFASVQAALDETKQSLSDAQSELSTQAGQIEQLQTSLSEAQHAANQSQYDMSAQQTELDRLREENTSLQNSVSALTELEQALTEENESLTAERDALREQVESLTSERDKLKEENQKLTDKSSFMDSYVVFVENDKSGLYHKYGCSAFSRKSFWAYSRKLAESFGYTACPKCFG